MKPKVQAIQHISQGSDDPTTPWAKARFNFVKQLLIRFQLLDPTTMVDPIAVPLIKQDQTQQTQQTQQTEQVSTGKLIVVLGGEGSGCGVQYILRPTGRR